MKRLLLILAWVSTALHADESKHRIIGLSEPSRVDDLREQVKTITGVELASIDPVTTEAVIRYDLAALFPAINPKKPPTEADITQKLDSVLKAASRGTFTLKPTATLAEDKMQKIEIQAGLLDCKACRYGAYIAIAKIHGVEHATVSPTNLLSIWIDPAKTNRDALLEALKKGRVEVLTP